MAKKNDKKSATKCATDGVKKMTFGSVEDESVSDEKTECGDADIESISNEEQILEDSTHGKKREKMIDKILGRKISEQEKHINELSDKLLRSRAEFDNYRKRTEKEKAQMFKEGSKDVIEKLLPIVDNFERAFETITEEDKEDAFVKGMEMVYKQIMTMFEGLDVKPIKAVGKEFNPGLHNAVMHVEDESVGENVVVQELQKGWTYKDEVVRYSMVKVAN